MYVYVDVNEGEDLRLGIRSDNRRSDGTPHPEYKNGWFKCDYFRINKIDDATTGMLSAFNAQRPTLNSETIYDLQGRKIGNRQSASSKLMRDIYIKNGKKIVNL